VIHAAAYTVELFEEGTSGVRKFHRTAPENPVEPLVELRVVNLQPGSYGACVRCSAPCGCESASSAWSFLPPMWAPMASCWQQGPMPTQVHQAIAPPPAQPSPKYVPSPSLLSTNPLPPPPPADPPATALVGGSSGSAHIGGPPAAAAGGAEVLVLD